LISAKVSSTATLIARSIRVASSPLVLEDGTAIGEVPAILRYLEEIYPQKPLHGETATERALITMCERRVEQEGFASVMEAIRNTAPGLKSRAIAGPHDYDQIPALVDRSKLRLKNFFADLDARLLKVPFVGGEHYSIADITALLAVDFAAKAINVSLPNEHEALKRWYDLVSKRPSASA
jgi:glutathione S-transferase